MSRTPAELVRTVETIAKDIQAGEFRSEADISRGVVTLLLRGLGWPDLDIGVVAPEFPIGARKVDYALCHPRRKPAVLVEVKGLGKADSRGQEQLFKYCFHKGVPIAVLTDGREWSLFFPSGQGGYEERRFARIDLVDDDSTHVATTLAKYLNYDDVRSGGARRQAERDYEAVRAQKEAASNYATVWRKLLSGPEPLLLDLLLEEVEARTGVRPERRSAAEFIRNQAGVRVVAPAKPSPKPTVSRTLATESSSKRSKPATISPRGRPSFTLRGQTRTFRSAKELFVTVFETFASADPDFCRRYSEQHTGPKRAWVAKTREGLYPGQPGAQQNGAHALPRGWWLGTYVDNPNKLRRIKQACEVAGLVYGQDVIVHMPIRSRKKGD